MTRTQKQDVQVLQQRNQELTLLLLLQDANLLILTLNTMIEVAEQKLQIPIRKKSGTKRSQN